MQIDRHHFLRSDTLPNFPVVDLIPIVPIRPIDQLLTRHEVDVGHVRPQMIRHGLGNLFRCCRRAERKPTARHRSQRPAVLPAQRHAGGAMFIPACNSAGHETNTAATADHTSARITRGQRLNSVEAA